MSFRLFCVVWLLSTIGAPRLYAEVLPYPVNEDMCIQSIDQKFLGIGATGKPNLFFRAGICKGDQVFRLQTIGPKHLVAIKNKASGWYLGCQDGFFQVQKTYTDMAALFVRFKGEKYRAIQCKQSQKFLAIVLPNDVLSFGVMGPWGKGREKFLFQPCATLKNTVAESCEQ